MTLPERTNPASIGDDRDLYCLGCGYNLRGLPGDPRCCPECGHVNRVADLEVPAQQIKKALRRLETGPALCGAMTATLAGWLLPILYLMLRRPIGPPFYLPWTVVSLIAGAVIVWIVGLMMTRSSCGARRGWVVVSIKFSVSGLWIWCSIFAELALIVHVIQGIRSAVRGPLTPTEFGELVVSIAAAVGVFLVAAWLYRWARRSVASLQREAAVRLIREKLDLYATRSYQL